MVVPAAVRPMVWPVVCSCLDCWFYSFMFVEHYMTGRIALLEGGGVFSLFVWPLSRPYIW